MDSSPRNGSHALMSTLNANEVTVCFANPGTSEMHFVAGLDHHRELRGVLCLFEGVATGAADGYARVTQRAAATLLHLGPGLANGWANLHNARRARVPVFNIVGDHATYHTQYDAPLQSNIAALAGALEGWYRRSVAPDEVANDVVDGLRAAYAAPHQVATLVLPADVSWGELENIPSQWPRAERPTPVPPSDDALMRAVECLRRGRGALLLGGQITGRDLEFARRVATMTESRVIVETFPTSLTHGAGVDAPERLIYLSEFAIAQLGDLDGLVLVGATIPVGFFAYPGVASVLVQENCEIVDLAPAGVDAALSLAALVDLTAAPKVTITAPALIEPPTGELTPETLAAAIASTMPDDLIIADESNTSGLHLYAATRSSPTHELLTLTGGAIGYGLPVALGAAVGAQRRVLALESDGSLMYTPQALWSMAREGLDVTVVVLANRSYAILNLERRRVGAGDANDRSQRLLDLSDPVMDLAALARSLGVPAVTVTTADDLVRELRRSYATPGPSVIEAVLPTPQF